MKYHGLRRNALSQVESLTERIAEFQLAGDGSLTAPVALG